MKRYFGLLSVLVTASMLLSACITFRDAGISPEETDTGEIPDTGAIGSTVLPTIPIGTLNPFPGDDTDETREDYSQEYIATSQAYNVTGIPDTAGLGTTIPQTGGTGFGTSIPDTGGLGQGTAITGTAITGPDVVMTPQPQATFGGGMGNGTAVAGTVMPESGGLGAGGRAFLRMQSLIGFRLQDGSGNNSGQISDLVISLPETRVAYLVVMNNGRQVLVPWESVTSIDSNNQSFLFNNTSNRFQNAPEFNPQSVDFTNPEWDADVQNAWGSGSSAGVQTPQPGLNTGGGLQQAVLASRLLSMQVSAQVSAATTAAPGSVGDTTVVGQVYDAVINRSAGEIPWLLVSLGQGGSQDQVIPVPFSALNHSTRDGLLLLSSPAHLQSAPGLDINNLVPEFGAGWDQDFQNFWNSITSQP